MMTINEVSKLTGVSIRALQYYDTIGLLKPCKYTEAGYRLYDDDTVSESNLNRQLIALHSTVGRQKTEVMRDRILDINPDCDVRVFNVFYLPENAETYPLEGYTYIADAVDTVAAKIELAVRAHKAGVPIASCMGAGNKLHPEAFRISDISKTETDPLARIMRRELKKRGIKKLLCVWSDESPVPASIVGDDGRPAPASIACTPSAMGLIMAGEIIRRLTTVSHSEL